MKNKTLEITTFAILIEAIVTYYNQFIVQESFCWQMFFSLILGILVAVAYKVDLPSYFNLKSDILYIGNILTGILLSRGSNYLFDLLNSLTKLWRKYYKNCVSNRSQMLLSYIVIKKAYIASITFKSQYLILFCRSLFNFNQF